jgi:thiamine biosynthesis lipoprotein
MKTATSETIWTMRHEEEVMGTVVVLDLYADASVTSDALAPSLRAAIHELHEADRIFSTYDPASALSRVGAGTLDLADAPRVISDVLELCRDARELSDGWFNPWGLAGGVDPTGYVKGWAAQRALEQLRSGPARAAMVNAAGDVVCYGVPRTGELFRVGIVDPFRPDSLVALVDLRAALATSGTYERGEHLIDPSTGRADHRLASASVSGPDLGMCDALATALSVAGEEMLAIIDSLAGYEAFIVGLDRTRRWTTGFALAGVTDYNLTAAV